MLRNTMFKNQYQKTKEVIKIKIVVKAHKLLYGWQCFIPDSIINQITDKKFTHFIVKYEDENVFIQLYPTNVDLKEIEQLEIKCEQNYKNNNGNL